jgi:hypothetical protein
MKSKNIVLYSVVALSTFAGAANAALDKTIVDTLKAEVLADVGTAVAAGFAVMTVVLASSVGMSLLGRFLNKGASGG